MMIQGTNRLRIICLNTSEGISFVVQVECTSTWVVILRTREGTSLVDQFKWRVHPLVVQREQGRVHPLWIFACKGFYKVIGNLKNRWLLGDWM
ncbi:hypothetical protein HKD37_15G044184 [Glycine soja]